MNYLETILAIVTSLGGGSLLGVFLERRKRKAETDIIEADVLERIKKSYGDWVDEFQKKYEEIKQENEALKKENKAIRAELNSLKNQLRK